MAQTTKLLHVAAGRVGGLDAPVAHCGRRVNRLSLTSAEKATCTRCVAAALAASAVPAWAIERDDYRRAGGRLMTILEVVEDEATLSRDARETLAGLGIEVHEIRDGMVQMGDDQSGPYEPATVAAVERACEAADADQDADTARRFDLFHDELAKGRRRNTPRGRQRMTDATYTMDDMIRRCMEAAASVPLHLVGDLDRMAPRGDVVGPDPHRQEVMDSLIAEYARDVARSVREALGYGERREHHAAESRSGLLGIRPTDGLRRVEVEEAAIAAAAGVAVRHAVIQYQDGPGWGVR